MRSRPRSLVIPEIQRELQRELQHCGLRQLHAINAGQNAVFIGTYDGRRVIVKARRHAMRRRLEKEHAWLIALQHSSVPVPQLISRTSTSMCTALILAVVPAGHPPVRLASLRELHERPRTHAGWGFLRADGRAPHADAKASLNWYQQQVPTLSGSQAIASFLESTWKLRHQGFIHGDCHGGNVRNGSWLDWESVSVADPLEEWCRYYLAHPSARTQALIRAENPAVSETRLQLAFVVSVLDSHRHWGPRQKTAQQWLQRWLSEQKISMPF